MNAANMTFVITIAGPVVDSGVATSPEISPVSTAAPGRSMSRIATTNPITHAPATSADTGGSVA